jgi:hypothetical protein
MKKMVFATLLLFCSALLQAQSRSTNSTDYQTALGLKIWDGAGITLKHFGASRQIP